MHSFSRDPVSGIVQCRTQMLKIGYRKQKNMHFYMKHLAWLSEEMIRAIGPQARDGLNPFQ